MVSYNSNEWKRACVPSICRVCDVYFIFKLCQYIKFSAAADACHRINAFDCAKCGKKYAFR